MNTKKVEKKEKYQNIKDSKFEVRLLCRDCGKMLNSTTPFTSEELQKNWTRLVLNSGFNSGKCPKGCRSTFSDLNINTDMPIYDIKTNKPIDYQLLKFLDGHFYNDDYDKVCNCKKRKKDEIYISDKYPAVHGKCGRWLKFYRAKDEH